MRATAMSRIVAVTAMLALAGACSDDPTGPPVDPPPEAPGTLSLAPENATLLLGRVLVLRVRLIDEFGNISQGTGIRWMSSDPAVATVSAAGVVRGIAAGEVRITAMAGTKSRVSTIQVVIPAAPKPELRPNLEPWRLH
jgi:Bacterial Ig-like domain (group 2)